MDRFRKSIVVLSMFCLVTGQATAGDSDDEEIAPGCTGIATAAFKACRHEIQDDFWIATGNCNNLPDPSARAECNEKAKAAREEAREDCEAQRAARGELCTAIGEAPYAPQINRSMFVNPADIGGSVAPNPYFPLVRGRTWILKSGDETITTTVTRETKRILGVTCAVIQDVVEEDGEVIESTKDWYAQDLQGNVWYFGESTQDFENGELFSIDGSWTAGLDGARAGIVMKAMRTVGDVYRQEFSLANAEDAAEIISLTGSASVPAGSCNGDCLITKDYTPISPGVFEHKYYAPGVGMILEVDPNTGKRVELVEIRN